MTPEPREQISGEIAVGERAVLRLIPLSRLCAAFIVVCGAAIAWHTESPHWVDSAGKVVIVVSLFFTYLQFRLEFEYHERQELAQVAVKRELADRGIPLGERDELSLEIKEEGRNRFNRARHRVLMNALVLAGCGELVAAFGSFVFEAIGHALRSVA